MEARQTYTPEQEAFLAQRGASDLAVPTDAETVVAWLRRLGAPALTYGENAYDQRERLRALLAADKTGTRERLFMSVRLSEEGEKHESEEYEEYFVQGHASLPALRQCLTLASFASANRRLTTKHGAVEDGDETPASPFGLCASYALGAVVPSALCATADGVCVGDNTGSLHVYSLDGARVESIGGAHPVRVTAVCSFPQPTRLSLDACGGPYDAAIGRLRSSNAAATDTAPFVDRLTNPIASSIRLASGDNNGTIAIHTGTGQAVRFEGHEGRVSQVVAHPHVPGVLLSAGFETTWRVHDLGSGAPATLQVQQGHTAPAYGLAVHPDGALVCTAGLDACMRLWDARTGRCVGSRAFSAPGGLLGVSFSPDGRAIAVGGADGVVRLVDLRQSVVPRHTLHAHTGPVVGVAWAGAALCSWSGDGGVRCHVRAARGAFRAAGADDARHEGRVVGGAVCADGGVYTLGTDRTLKQWGDASLVF